MNLSIGLPHLRSAGRRRVKVLEELLGEFYALPAHHRLAFLKLALPPVAGAAQISNAVIANVALTTTQATLVNVLGIGQAPLQLALGFVSQVTGVAAGANVTANIVRGDTSAVIGSAVVTNNGAGAGAVGGVDPLAIVPPGVTPGGGVLMQAAVSSGTGTAVGSATAPITLAIVGVA